MKWILVALALVALPAIGVDRFALIWGKFDGGSRDERAEIASDLRDRVAMLARHVPAPSPADVEWAEKEAEEIEKLGNSPAAATRFLRFYDSPRNQFVKLHAALAELEAALACAADGTAPMAKEMACWSRAGVLLSDSAFFQQSISVLTNSGMLLRSEIADALGITVDAQLFYRSYELWGRAVQQYVVYPYLKGMADEAVGVVPTNESESKAPLYDAADPDVPMEAAR